MEKICGNCKYKGDPVMRFDDDELDEAETGYFVCGLIKHGNDSSKIQYQSGYGAVVEDGSGYYAALCVEDDFGCIKWESA